MGSGYPFVDGKKYSGASAKYKAQPQSFACKWRIKRFSLLTQTKNFYSMFYSGGEQKKVRTSSLNVVWWDTKLMENLWLQ